MNGLKRKHYEAAYKTQPNKRQIGRQADIEAGDGGGEVREARRRAARRTVSRLRSVVGVTLLEHPEVVGVCGLRFMSALMELLVSLPPPLCLQGRPAALGAPAACLSDTLLLP